MRYAFASDFDGTLCFNGTDFHEEDLEAIKNFQKKGGLFGVCTGRSLSGITMILPKDITLDFYILASGAQILDRGKKPLYERTIPKKEALEVIRKYEGECDHILHGADLVYSFGKGYPWQIHIDSMADMKEDQVFSISLGFPPEERARQIAAEINREYGSCMHAFVNVQAIDIAPAGCSKGEALKKCRKLLNVERIAGIGDSWNDIPLIEAGDPGYTFHHSPEEVRKHADCLVDSVNEALENFEQAK
jgi:Cof subfamily protein (haloacid dehalogenase superfamily)